MSERDQHIVTFLNTAGIVCADINSIDGLQIPREVLLSEERYKAVQENIPVLKTMFSSSYLTSLQASAPETQKWPLLNLVRQILKSYGFLLTPKRLCDGYTKDKKKKYRRTFVIERMKKLEEKEQNNEDASE